MSCGKSRKWPEVLLAFLKLGCTAFGGPIAHLGYFQQEFVARRRWLAPEEFADLVALCQFLPGPASSQVGLGLGWKRAGWRGALAAWLGFTVPSALLMLAFALGVGAVRSLPGAGWVQGLKLAAVAVVAQAVLAMGRRLCPDALRAGIAAVSAAVLVLLPTPGMQVVVIAAGAAAGLGFARGRGVAPVASAAEATERRFRWPHALIWYAALLAGLPLLARLWPSAPLQVAAVFYRSGALVFGGGHVILPLLENATVPRGWLSQDAFLAGYGAAQALPGPLSTFAAYLGAIIPPGGVGGAVLALGALYLPAALVLFGTLPLWEAVKSRPQARALMAGANAAVVGLLIAAFYSPICTSSVTDWRRLLLAATAFAGLQSGRLPPWAAVALCATAGAIWLR